MKPIESMVLFVLVTFVVIISHDYAYAEELETIQIEIKYTNGDIADFNGMKLIVYQDFDKFSILEKVLENNPETITVPKNHKYKIEVYANGMYADVQFLQVNNNSEEILFKIPLSGGLKFNVFYDDGRTPIEGTFNILMESIQSMKTSEDDAHHDLNPANNHIKDILSNL